MLTNFFLSLLFDFFTSLFSESRLAIRPCPHPVRQSGHKKNVDFGIRPREVRLLAGVFCFVRKISKIGATRFHILRLKWTKFDFRWGSAGGAYSAPQTPVFKGPTSKEREGKGRRRGDGKRRGRGGDGTGG